MSSDAAPDLLIVVGLTGVGKSTVLTEVMRAEPSWRLLPNRRELTDRIILPAVQRRLGVPETCVEDRLERFRLTAGYRDMHPGGMAHALEEHIREHVPGPADRSITLVFDNLRGQAEVSAAAEAFPHARFLLLDAMPATRLARLVERRDPFDRVTATDRDEAADLERAAAIIMEEQRNYDSTAARRHLAARLPADRFLAVDTDDLTRAEVVRRVLAWLERNA